MKQKYTKVKPLKDKPCRMCKALFIPRSSTQIACGLECAIKYAEKKREAKELNEYKVQKRATREAKEKFKTRSEWMKEVQTVFNSFIRARDKNLGCCSCDKPASWQGQWHASHYRSVGSAPELRFEELNVHKSCSVCNNHLSGNIMNYRIKLVEKIGKQAVEWLEGKHEAKHYTIDDLKELKRIYREKIKQLEAA